jgi:hypothetical protein
MEEEKLGGCIGTSWRRIGDRGVTALQIEANVEWRIRSYDRSVRRLAINRPFLHFSSNAFLKAGGNRESLSCRASFNLSEISDMHTEYCATRGSCSPMQAPQQYHLCEANRV